MHTPPSDTAHADTAATLHAMLHALSEPDFNQTATRIASCLSKTFKCSYAAIGMLKNHQNQLSALSSSVALRKELGLPRKIMAAMNEATDQCACLRYPPNASDLPRITLMHHELASSELGSAILSIPLPYQQQAIGAITLIRSIDNPWSETEKKSAEQLATSLGPLLQLKQISHETLLTRMRRVPNDFFRHLRKPGLTGGRIFSLLAIIAFLMLLFIPVQDRITAPASLENIVQRSISAPVDSFIQDVLVRPGAQLNEGQLLLTLSDQDLRFEQSRLQAELARYRSEQAEAFARQDRVRMVSSEARSEEVSTQLALIKEQIDRTRITAPFPGIVIKGDQEHQAGAPVKRGEVLMVLAPSADYRLVLHVDERDIARLKTGQQGRVSFAAMPGKTLAIQIKNITPVASIVDGINSFSVEASLTSKNENLRPGLEGVAHIDMEKRPFAWLWGSRLLDWLDFKLWIVFG